MCMCCAMCCAGELQRANRTVCVGCGCGLRCAVAVACRASSVPVAASLANDVDALREAPCCFVFARYIVARREMQVEADGGEGRRGGRHHGYTVKSVGPG